MWQTLLYQNPPKSWLNARLKSDIDNLYIDKLNTAPIDLGMLCNVVKKNDVIKKIVYDELVTAIKKS